MILILEIWLTISAWRNGWKLAALLPMGLAFLVGAMIGAADPDVGLGGLLMASLFVDGTAIAVLFWMSHRSPARIVGERATDAQPREAAAR